MEKEKIRRLVLQAGQGDRAAFGELYEETGRSVYFNCLKLLGNAQQAEDITQDTFMKALEKLDSLKEPENFSAWVNRIAINNCKMYFRKNPRTAEEESEKIIDDTPDSELIPDDYADSEEKRRIIMNIIDTALTDEQRQTIILYYFDMMSVAEIAEIMECSVGTVTSRLSAARKKIREAVLIYEKKNNDRLHAVMPIPVLSKIFMQECQHLKLPELSVFSNTAAAEDIVPDKNTTISKSGGKGMFSTAQDKNLAKRQAISIIEKEKTRKAKQTQKIKEAQNAQKQEADNNAILNDNIDVLNQRIKVLEDNRTQSQTEIEKLSIQLINHKKAIRRAAIGFTFAVILGCLAFWGFNTFSTILSRVVNTILSCGGLWGFGSFSINLYKSFKK